MIESETEVALEGHRIDKIYTLKRSFFSVSIQFR